MESLTESQFHTVWTEAVGREGYNKNLFQEVLIALKNKNRIKPDDNCTGSIDIEPLYELD